MQRHNNINAVIPREEGGISEEEKSFVVKIISGTHLPPKLHNTMTMDAERHTNITEITSTPTMLGRMSMPRPTPMRTLGSNTTYYCFLMIIIPAALTVPMLLHIYMLNDLKLEMPSVQAQDFFQQQHERGQTELQRNISEQCWRTCPQRINKIYFQHGRAGLEDRLT
eukprot:scaffold3594_cov142-Skeletonema_dohrnii-CCMP3373.AAC.6